MSVRGYAKLPNHWWSKQEFVEASKSGLALWIKAVMFSADRLTDGLLERWELTSILGFTNEDIQTALDDGLLSVHAGQDTFRVAFFFEMSRPKEEILKERDKKRKAYTERARKGGLAKAAKARERRKANLKSCLDPACGLLSAACACTKNSELTSANAEFTKLAQDARAHRWSQESLRIAEFALADENGYYSPDGFIRPEDWLTERWRRWSATHDGDIEKFEECLARYPRMVD